MNIYEKMNISKKMKIKNLEFFTKFIDYFLNKKNRKF